METFFIDLDGTLKTDIDFNEFGNCNGYETYDVKRRSYPYKIRPYAKEFLTELKKLGNVCILTLASQPYAEYFIDRIGARDVVDEIYSRDRFNDIVKVSSYILVENDAGIAKGKQCLIENGCMVFKRQTIIVPTYDGGEDDILLKLLEKIRGTVS